MNDPAYRLAAVMLADRGAAEDAVQEASLKDWRKLKLFLGPMDDSPRGREDRLWLANWKISSRASLPIYVLTPVGFAQELVSLHKSQFATDRRA